MFTQCSRTTVLALALAVCFACSADAQPVEREVDSASRQLEEARAAHLNLIAPRSFERANKALDEASIKLSQGGKIEDIRRKLAELQAALENAARLREIGEITLREALAARQDALASNAPQFSAQPWSEAEKAIRNAGREIENGDQTGAGRHAQSAAKHYREAELQAIRADLLGNAKNERVAAVQGNAAERAPVTFEQADVLLAQAEQVLLGDRYERAKARGLAERATEEFKHARLIAQTSLEIDKDRKKAPERVLLAYESEIVRIAEVLRYQPRFSEGVDAVAGQLIAAVNSVVEDRDSLQGQLANSRKNVASLESQLDALAERDAELQQRERRERQLQEVRRIFAPSEADVLLRGGDLIVRMYALSFASGSSEIRPENFSLLTKVQRVLREFPDALTAIEGHTDSQGDDDYNQSLSQRRAEAVRTYLLANMTGRAAKAITAVGFGEGQPVANNETADGRAKNRRIDIVVELDSQLRAAQ